MIRKSIYFYFFSLFIFSNFGCKNIEPACILEGKWYFHHVNRNYKPTNTLEGGYFEFLDASKFRSNIFDEATDYSYSYTNETIEINADEKLNFTVVKCSNDTLIMAGEISSFYMNFLMTRIPVENKSDAGTSVDEDLK